MVEVEALRKHLLFVLEGEVAERLQWSRSRWDPVMASRIPPHVTLAYPEETTDEALVIERAADAAAETAPFVIHLDEVELGDRRAGVWFSIIDPSETWQRLRSSILAPPLSPLSVMPHATVVHPRTSRRGREAFVELDGTRFDGDVVLNEILYTETSRSGMQILDRFPLTASPPIRVVAGLLRRNGRLLLCHRRPDRSSYPNVWDLPGGHVNENESATEALTRELAEELGIAIDLPEGPPWMTVRADGLELYLFLVDAWDGKPGNVAVDEHDDLTWAGIDDLGHLDLAHPSYPELLKRALT